MSDFDQMWQQEQAAGQARRSERPLSFYGKLALAGRYVILQKGLPGGKRDFDPEQDPEDAKRMCVRVEVEPVSDRSFSNFQREFLVSSAEGDLFRDAVTALGTTVQALAQGPYVRLDVVEDPRLGSYPDRTTGVTRQRSTGLVRELFPDEAACRAAAEARYGGGSGAQGSWAGLAGNPASPPSPATQGPTVGPATGPVKPESIPGVQRGVDRATTAKFFPGLWQRAAGDPDAFLRELGNNKVMTKHFDPTSPEVLEFLTRMGHPSYAQDARRTRGTGMTTRRSTSRASPSDPLVQVLVDTREPDWVRSLPFGGAHVIPALIEAGDLLAMTASGTPILVERKTAGDLLSSIKDGRLIAQAALMRQTTEWAYLVITEPMYPGRFGQVMFQPTRGRTLALRETAWGWHALQGALTTVQDLGVGVVWCGGDDHFEATCLWLFERERGPVAVPRRAGLPLPEGEAILCALPGVGPERARGAAAGLWVGGLGPLRPDRGAFRRQVHQERGRGGAQDPPGGAPCAGAEGRRGAGAAGRTGRGARMSSDEEYTTRRDPERERVERDAARAGFVEINPGEWVRASLITSIRDTGEGETTLTVQGSDSIVACRLPSGALLRQLVVLGGRA